jgi:hypothetical protein
LVLLVVSIATFALFFYGPADPALAYCPETRCTPQRLEQITTNLGLDRPVLTQYGEYMKGIVAGNDFEAGSITIKCPAPCLGVSFKQRVNVYEYLKGRFPATLSVALGAAAIFLSFGVLVGITAAMPAGTGLNQMQERFPDRFFDVGICEQHAVTFAAGLVAQGMRPVCALYSTFLQRGYDQFVHDVCLQNLPVVFAVDRAGFVGEDSPTHNGAFDLSFLRAVPNAVVMAPRDDLDLCAMLKWAIAQPGPVVIRYPRDKAPTIGPAEPRDVTRGEILREWQVFEPFLGADKIINMPIAKHHSLTGCTLGMKNWYGILGGQRNQLHQHVHESLADLADFIRPTLTVMDAYRILIRNGPTGGNLEDVVMKKTLVASTDPVALDAYVAKAYWDLEAEALPYLKFAQKRGLGTPVFEQVRTKAIKLS